MVIPSAGLMPAWSLFQPIAPPWCNAGARSRACNALFRQSFAGVAFAGVAFAGVAFVGVASLPALAAIPARNRFQRETCVVRRAGTCSQRINLIAIPAPSRAASGRRRAGFPRLVQKALVGECRREVIVAGRGREAAPTAEQAWRRAPP